MTGLTAMSGDPDPLNWARFPRSQTAVDFLVKGASHDPRLADILAEHRDSGMVTARGELNRDAVTVAF